MIAEMPLQNTDVHLGHGVTLSQGAFIETARRLLTPEVVALLARLHRQFEPERRQLLRFRAFMQAGYNAGELPKFPNPMNEAASGTWTVASLPSDLLKRRVEITGPVNHTKMVINMLSRNAEGVRADAAMLDFEDSMKPTWTNVMMGLENLIGAVDGTLTWHENGKTYRFDPADRPVIMVRVRGLHLNESNLRVDGVPISGGLFDFVTSFYHTAKQLVEQGHTPKYYVPKTEYHPEARWWNQLFSTMEKQMSLPVGTMRATFLIETLPAAFEMEEILYEFRDHAAGLNVGRWDKIFSDIKVLHNHSNRILADRASITLQRPWMMNYAKRLIRICHQHGAFAMGGMSAFTPGKTPELRSEQTARVAEDKRFEAEMGHDGCWVSHPYFIGHAMNAFTRENQLDIKLSEFEKYPDLIPQATGPKTLAGLRKNVRVGIAYLQGWNDDLGCVAWDNLMEDLATLEISRVQIWQWLHHRIALDDGTVVTRELVKTIFDEELDIILRESKNVDPELWKQAKTDAECIFLSSEFQNYLTTDSEIVNF